jgi:hypothetical protein
MHPRFSPFAKRDPVRARMLLAMLLGASGPERWWLPDFKPPPRRPMPYSLREVMRMFREQNECQHEWNKARIRCVRCYVERREVEFCGRRELVR